MRQRQAHVPREILPGLVTGWSARLFCPTTLGMMIVNIPTVLFAERATNGFPSRWCASLQH